MRFGMLGPLEVVEGGRVLDLGRPKQRALLAVLLLDANRVVSLDRLIDLLWGDEPPARSTTSLQAYVSNLRRILEPRRSPRAPAAVLVTEPPGYLLRVEADDLDAARFERLAAEGARLLAGGRPETALAALDAALALWRGPVLAQFTYEDFAQHAITRWEEQREVAREDRAEALLALGRHQQAVADLEALVADAPLRERRWELLILALYRSGRQADGLRAYARARDTLAEEMGVDPGPALARLEADVLAQAPHLDWSPPHITPSAVPGPPPDPAPLPVAGPPGLFLGRDEELAALSEAVDDLVAGRPGVVLVSGEAGIGKSRLLEALADAAAARAVLVCWGRTYEGGAAPPYWPWIQVLRGLTDDDGTGALRDGDGAALVAQLVPGLAERWGTPRPQEPPREAETARFRLYDAVTTLVRAAGRRRKVAIVLDDLHWSDPASLGLTAYLAGQPDLGGILLVASYRPEDAASGDDLVAALAALARVPGLRRVEVSGLPPAEVGRFVAGATGVEPSHALVRTLHNRTDGNPFYLGELVRLLAAERSLDAPAAAIATAIPVGVRDVVRRRLTRLPETSNRLLRLAAVAGRDFDLAVLTAAGPIDEEQALLSIEAALLIGVVVEDPAAVGRYRFAHALVRDAVYEQLSALRRARLHGQVGRALEARATGDERLAELAHHFFEAAPADGPEAGIAFALRAADAARAQLAHEAAFHQLRRALELVARMPGGPQRAGREVDVQLRLAGLYGMVRGFASAELAQVVARISELCQEFGLTEGLVAGVSGEWIFTMMRGDYTGARALRDRMVDLARATEDPLAGTLSEYQNGFLAYHRGDFGPAVVHLDRAVDLVRRLDPARLLEMLYVLPESLFLAISAMAHWMLDDADAMARSAVSVAVAEAADHPFSVAIALVNASVMDGMGGDATAAMARTERALALTTSCGMQADAAQMRVLRGWARAALGDADAGVADAEAGLAETVAAGRVMSRSWLLGLVADARRRAGRLDEALGALDDADAVVDGSVERFWLAELHRLRGEVLLAKGPGRRQEAEAWLRRSVEVATAQGAVRLRRRAEESLARLQPAPFG